MKGCLHHRYQDPRKTGGPEPFSGRDTRGPDPQWEPVQRTYRVPRWAYRALQTAAERAGSSEAAICRAWIMDAAEQWLAANNLPLPSPPSSSSSF